MEENAKKDWEFHFVEEKMTDEDYKYYKSFNITGKYTGKPVLYSFYWIVDREKKMYLIGNEAPNRRDHEQEGLFYYNFIYKDKVNLIGSDGDLADGVWIDDIKEIVLDKSLEAEHAYICEAIKQSMIAYVNNLGRKCIIKEMPEKIEYYE